MRSIGRSWGRSILVPSADRGAKSGARYGGRPKRSPAAFSRARAAHRGPEGAFFTSYFSPIRDETGAVVANLATAFETTNAVKEKAERDRAERALRESEARLKAAVDLVKLGRYSWNPQTNELDWDEKCREIGRA